MSWALGVIFAPAAAVIGYPWVAGVIGLAFGAGYIKRRRRSLGVMALLWVCYCAYEYGMKFRVLCSGECNIRVDLLLIWPVLAIGSLVAIWSASRASKQSAG